MSNKKAPADTCVLVTGGAGFIGSHTVVDLLESGYQVVVVDDLSNASEKVLDRIDQIVGDEASERLSFVRADVCDRDALEAVFDEFPIDAVIHFAGFKAVGESVAKPVEYYSNNLGSTLTLVDAMRVGGDNGPWERRWLLGVEPATTRYFFNGRVWYNDPDPVYLRDKRAVGKARLMASS